MNFVPLVALIAALSAVAPAAHTNDNELRPPHNDNYKLHKDCEEQLRKQVNEEMHANLVYLNMAAHFDQNTVARKGFAKFFADNSEEERQHALKFIKYITRRGSALGSLEIKMPKKTSWYTGLEALHDALNLEKKVNNHLYHLREMAEEICKDHHLTNFVDEEYLTEQVDSINKLQQYISILDKMNTSMGEYFMDRQLLGEKIEL